MSSNEKNETVEETMSMEKVIQSAPLTTTEQTLLSFLSDVLFQSGRKLPDHIDWEKVLVEAEMQSVLLLIWSGIDPTVLPTDVLDRWRKRVIASVYWNARVTAEHHQVHEMMTEAGIPYAILKGCASAYYYPNSVDRPLGDVDFLVDKENLEKADSVLKSEGFTPWDQEHICHIVYRKESTRLEMHFEPAGVPDGRPGELVREYFRDMTNQAKLISIDGTEMKVPSVFHHGLTILLHTSHHMLGEGIGLRHLCDWAVFVASLSDEEFTGLFEARLKEIGLWRFTCLITQVCVRYLGCPSRKWAGPEDSVVDEIIRDIFSGGNFGCKDRDRVYESLMISDRGKNGVGSMSPLRQFIYSVNKIIRTNYPVVKKCPLLIPAGWLIIGGKYVWRVIRGERSQIHPKEMISGASARRELYEQFRLFIKE